MPALRPKKVASPTDLPELSCDRPLCEGCGRWFGLLRTGLLQHCLLKQSANAVPVAEVAKQRDIVLAQWQKLLADAIENIDTADSRH